MAASHFRVIRDISFVEIRDGKMEKIDVYKEQVKNWIILPTKVLASGRPRNTDYGMTILATLLLFFEPHGQYLEGKSSNRRSAELFTMAFNQFINFGVEHELIGRDVKNLDAKKVYKWARCGLFHTYTLRGDLLVDAINITTTPIERNRIVENTWLINPWLLIDVLGSYLDEYVEKIKNNRSSKLASNFNRTFNRLVYDPLNEWTIKSDKGW